MISHKAGQRTASIHMPVVIRSVKESEVLSELVKRSSMFNYLCLPGKRQIKHLSHLSLSGDQGKGNVRLRVNCVLFLKMWQDYTDSAVLSVRKGRSN